MTFAESTVRNPVTQRLDPRTVIVAYLLVAAIPFCFNAPAWVAGTGVIVLLVGALTSCLGLLRRMARALLLLILVNTVLWQLYAPGTRVVWQAGPLTITAEGLQYGFASALRFAWVVYLAAVFLAVTPTERLSAGLRRLGVPGPFVFTLTTALGLLPTFVESMQTILEAQRARGLRAQSRNPLRRARQLLPLTGPVVMYSLRQTRAMGIGLESRGFVPRGPRTEYTAYRSGALDVAVTLLAAALLGLGVVLRSRGYGVVLRGRL